MKNGGRGNLLPVLFLEVSRIPSLIDKERELSYPRDRCSVNAKVYAYKEVLFTGRFGSRPFYSVQLYRLRLLQNRPHDRRSARQFHEWDGWNAWRDGTEGAL